ncbi:DUF1129 domain-containing protein [Gilvimarinus polysaccharolyticus]|uniref:hypothetical protein n=1 Tax=Gilvimarinus polysaccharolyticus TaxID=863921 RepID=UPI000673562F|nr:hypothetical protein [Gilvimarinus polysaccharolyticus]
MNLKQKIQHHIDVPLAQSFKQFRLGSMTFFAGLVIIFGVSQLLTPSLTQELLTLLGLVITALGFGIAMLAQVRMMLGRLTAFWQIPKD